MDINSYNKALFWDTDINTLDPKTHARYIIERVLKRGSLSDWQVLKEMYNLEKIKTEVLQIRTMDTKTLHFCCFLFNLPKTAFRCYTTTQSIQVPWNGYKN